MNRAERRARHAEARHRKSWDWIDAIAGITIAWGRPLTSKVNDFYSVQRYEVDTDWGVVLHLAVRRHDGEPGVPWRDKQRIKDELAGPEAVAVEVFPPRSELVDEANLYHLWVLPIRLPFGLPMGGS